MVMVTGQSSRPVGALLAPLAESGSIEALPARIMIATLTLAAAAY